MTSFNALKGCNFELFEKSEWEIICTKKTCNWICVADCLYRNIYQYKYIALLDIDEVIMPLGNASNWSELMRNVEEASLRTKNTTRASYNFRNIYFMDEFLGEHMKQRGGDLDASDLELDDIPDHMHMLRHVYRSANYTKPGQVCVQWRVPPRVLGFLCMGENHFGGNWFSTHSKFHAICPQFELFCTGVQA